MAIWIYKKHPDHNLDGENYPHFRNTADKFNYIKKDLVDLKKEIKLHVTRLSFDTARLILSIKKFFNTGHPSQIAGIMSASDEYFKYEFWFVVGWSFGSNEEVVILELKLDYWLTYWPLKFNKALVRVSRKHMIRFTKDSTKEKHTLDFNKTNRQLQIPEKTTPPNILDWNADSAYPYLNIVPMAHLMIGIVFTPIGGTDTEEFKDNNFFVHLGDNRPRRQMGFLIFSKYNEPSINTWLSFPGITQTFYFFMDARDIHIVTFPIIKPSGAGDKFVGDYELDLREHPIPTPEQKWPTLDFVRKLNVVHARDWESISNFTTSLYKTLGVFLVELTTLSRMDNVKPENNFRLTIDSNGKVFWVFKDYYTKIQLVSLKSFITACLASSDTGLVTNQPIRKWKNVYFTTLNIFNKYMNVQKQNKKNFFEVSLGVDDFFKQKVIKKNTPVKWLRKLKLWSNFKYLVMYQNENHEIKPHLWKKLNEIKYDFGWFLTINNSYFIAEPHNLDLQPSNKKYNIVMMNHTTLPNYTDGSLEFYQKQGVSYETGINQAKYMFNWAKKYNQFQQAKVPFEAVTGTVNSAIGSFFTGTTIGQGQTPNKLGAVGAGFGAVKGAIAGGFNIAEMKLMNERREKQAYYALKTLQAKQEDIFNQPTTTHSNDKVEISYWLITDIILPRLVTMVPTDADLIAQAKLYHKFGNLNDQDEVVDLNNEWNRRCWNFWEIHNIEQAIVKDKLNYMVVTFFNNLFNKGVRLWNVFNEEVVFNDYSLENWESKLLADEK